MPDIFGDDNSNDIYAPENGIADNIFALGGDDIIRVHEESGNDNVDGGTGSDWIIVTDGGGAGVSVALGDRGFLGQNHSYFIPGTEPFAFGTLTSIENVAGYVGDDILIGSSGNNILHGGPEGDDYLEGGLGADELQGFDGIDTAGYLFAASSVFVFLNAPHINGGEAAGDTFISIENLEGSEFGDILSGDSVANKLRGNGGHDFLAGNGGSDQLLGGFGDDILAGGDGIDAMNGEDGSDIASYELATAAVLVDLASPIANTGFAAGDSYVSVENLRGSFYDDTLKGNGFANQISGDGGIAGESGDDQLFGRGGDDIFLAGPGDDMMSGGSGVDAVDYVFSTTAIRASLLAPANNTGTAAGDSYVSIEGLLGAAFADQLTGNNFANRLEGRGGHDKLFGNGGSDTLVGGLGADVLDGGAGIDTADYSAAASGLTVDLTSPGANTGEADNDSFVSIENVVGTAFFDRLNGNAANNVLDGGTDQDTLIGRAGADQLRGGAGDDVLDGGSSGDLFDGGAGSDVARYSSAATGVTVDLLDAQSLNTGDAVGDTYTSIENIEGSSLGDVLRGDDNANRIHDGDGGGHDKLAGRGGDDVLTGTAGNDTLEGGEGGDAMQGGLGIDAASYAEATEAVQARLLSAAGNGGEALNDSYTLIENLLGSGFGDVLGGNDLVNRLDGAGGDDFLFGLKGNDTLVGGAGIDTLNGGLGVDAMVGGLGKDVYEVDHSADTITEAANQGTDFVNSGATYKLGLNVEHLTLIGNAAVSGTGNGLANTITGNAAANVLNGAAGADIMIGGGGNDVFHVDNAGDVVIVPSGGADGGDGIDRVVASVSYALTAGTIEQLSTINSGATTAINLTGNAVINAITGNAGANTLDGRGGGDSMRGLLGNDVYVVDNASDVVIEAANQGADLVRSSISEALAANVENLELIGLAQIAGTGNTLANKLTGNAAANILDGKAGNDTVAGGGGKDAFQFSTALGAANVDRITDFNVADDTIRLENAVFTKLAAGGLPGQAFFVGAAAADASDRIIYNSASGALIYDANGNAAGAAVQFATLAPGLALTSADFVVV